MSDKKYKIIIIAYDLNPKLGSEAGCADLWVKIISKHYFVEVFTDEVHMTDILEENYENVHFHFIKMSDFMSRVSKKLKILNMEFRIFFNKVKPQIKKRIGEESFHLIHCLTPFGIYSYNDYYKFKLPVIVGPLGGGLRFPPGFRKIFKKNIVRNTARNLYYDFITRRKRWKQYFYGARKIIIGTPYLKVLLPKKCHSKTHIVYDVIVDPYKFNLVKKEDRNEIVITYVGRMITSKGSEILLESFRLICDKYKNLKLFFVGDGPLLPVLKKKAKTWHLDDKVIFFGKIPIEKVYEKLSQSDIFCLPTLREPGGGSILEAMACELPIITTNYGGPAYSVTDKCGIKISPVNYEDYVDKLAQALSHLIDNKEGRVRMGINGRQRIIEEFSPQAAEKKILEIYRDAARE